GFGGRAPTPGALAASSYHRLVPRAGSNRQAAPTAPARLDRPRASARLTSRRHNSGIATPPASAPIGTSEWLVNPGIVLISRNHHPAVSPSPAGSNRKSTRERS